jgi:hypothetical protein
MADFCTGAQHHGNAVGRPLPTEQVHLLWCPGVHGDLNSGGGTRGQFCTFGQPRRALRGSRNVLHFPGFLRPVFGRDPVFVPRRDISDASASKGDVLGRCDDLTDEYHMAAKVCHLPPLMSHPFLLLTPDTLTRAYSAPTAFQTIGWKFYLCFIIPGTIGGVVVWIWFPDTNGVPLEEVAAIFGDADEVAIYQRDIEVDFATHTIKDAHSSGGVKGAETAHFEADSLPESEK